MGDVLISRAEEPPVAVAELREYLRNPADGEAALLRLINAAADYVEEFTGIALMEQTRELTLDGWPLTAGGNGDGLGWWDGVRQGALIGNASRALELPRAPLIAVESVTTFDEASVATVWAEGNYHADTGSRPGRLALNAGAVWPIPTRTSAGIVIRYRAGHATAAAIPNALAMAVLQIAAHWYENRELVSLDGPTRVPMQAGRILSTFKIAKL